MAERPFQPVPNTPLVADPTGDAIWKRWLQNLQRFLASAVRGPGSSTDNAVARWDGTSGLFLNNSGVIIDDSNNVSGVVNLTTTGNTILGNASADTLTINAGAWTYGANWTATRAAGTLAAGSVEILKNVLTATGDISGTTNPLFLVNQADVDGANNINIAQLNREIFRHSGSGTITSANVTQHIISVRSTGNITTATHFRTETLLQNSGNITGSLIHYTATVPTFTSTGTVANQYAFRVEDISDSGVTQTIGLKVDDQTGSTIMTGIQSELSAGTGKKNLNITGTAENFIAGDVKINGDFTINYKSTFMFMGA